MEGGVCAKKKKMNCRRKIAVMMSNLCKIKNKDKTNLIISMTKTTNQSLIAVFVYLLNFVFDESHLWFLLVVHVKSLSRFFGFHNRTSHLENINLICMIGNIIGENPYNRMHIKLDMEYRAVVKWFKDRFPSASYLSL